MKDLIFTQFSWITTQKRSQIKDLYLQRSFSQILHLDGIRSLKQLLNLFCFGEQGKKLLWSYLHPSQHLQTQSFCQEASIFTTLKQAFYEQPFLSSKRKVYFQCQTIKASGSYFYHLSFLVNNLNIQYIRKLQECIFNLNK
ncbi:hypothetical protein TTHERM_000139729 (macronuclear) [Tetrahymena thermophila SB210]|uniref:Uncharacterized protein n=1 Tax=Tetrahymena thermophila (strain SB210) TaxID=312017 RepID=W7XIN7_TETTS|nr:hypothetical protein TTHERM_000139729 [Tetrahymena thermophila SB210]EWS73469.1 hypothetical protein TTHERM_000139729 [Tetrahymena thermophila SB210]|eukprot:XP_012653951.1 hypothetical protein TTHERM_000139729 [Tetrahymena thermophila SB210]